MTAIAHALTRSAWTAVGGEADAAAGVVFREAGDLPGAFPVADYAAAAIATAALAVAALLQHRDGAPRTVTVDRRLSAIWFWASIRPIGWTLPAAWDPLAGDYRARDGWIRLHTNAPHHRAAAEGVLGVHGDKEAVVRAVAGRSKGELEAAIVAAGGCAAEMRSADQWAQHPQGVAVAAEPLVAIAASGDGTMPRWPVAAARPLQGVRVLDLTRVLAAPVATRFLAGFGADVLRIDPPDWDEPGVVPEVTLGKRCARLDLRSAKDRAVFEELIAAADILVHGYRPGALDGLGFDAARRRALRPALIDVCLDAYGWSGPWAGRRGFDSLVQMSTGIADAGMRQAGADKPVPLPFQALDHATGYLMAAAAIRGMVERLKHGNGSAARLSLARTAQLLLDHQTDPTEQRFAPETEADWSATVEITQWGNARRVTAPVVIAGTAMHWDRPASGLGTAAARW